MIIGIDVGNKESGYCVCDSHFSIYESGKIENDNLFGIILRYINSVVVIEDITLHGKGGVSLRDTIEWIGRLKQYCIDNNVQWVTYSPQKYRGVLCNGNHSDAFVKRVLEYRFGDEYLKKNKFIGRGATSDVRSALALCWYYLEYSEKSS